MTWLRRTGWRKASTTLWSSDLACHGVPSFFHAVCVMRVPDVARTATQGLQHRTRLNSFFVLFGALCTVANIQKSASMTRWCRAADQRGSPRGPMPRLLGLVRQDASSISFFIIRFKLLPQHPRRLIGSASL